MMENRRQDTDRVAKARRTQRRLSSENWISTIIDRSKQIAARLSAEKTCLIDHANQLRSRLSQGVDRFDDEFLSMAAGGVVEAVRREKELTLFDVQVRAGIIVSCDAIAEMATGEGKTLSGIMPTFIRALNRNGVHVATTNDYLANRDHEQLRGVFQQFGMRTGALKEDDTLEQTQSAYQADVTFGAGHRFGFDFLRDQLVIKQSSSRIGQSTLNRLYGRDLSSRLRQRGLNAAIVDEADHVMIDDAVSPLILSSSSNDKSPDAEIHVHAREFCQYLQVRLDYEIDASGTISLTDRGFDRVYNDSTVATFEELVRPWHEYVVLALRARHVVRRDVDYIIADGKVQLVDASTGRIYEDRSWSDGLHQAVLAAEKLEITAETSALAKITRQRFYRSYKTLGGMTGTAIGCEKEFAKVYGLAVVPVPHRRPSQRTLLPQIVTISQAEKHRAISEETAALHRSGRPVLVGTLNIKQSEQIAASLVDRGIPIRVLNGVQDADEAAIVATAGRSGAVTVATNLAGRGTDIPLDDVVREKGGLHVIVAECHSLARVDRQLVGRSARCGDPGTARFYIAADDPIIVDHAPWLGRAIKRILNSGHRASDESRLMIQRGIDRTQKDLQRRASYIRLQLLEFDKQTQELISQDTELTACCEI